MGDTMEEESFLPNHLMVWKNILPSLDAAAAELSLGDLLHLEHFSLHESMSALEMMDAQMDSGLAASQAADIPPTPPPTAPLEPSALIGTLDELVCAEQAWLNGQPLAQTVFRLEWMHAPLEVGDQRLAERREARARVRRHRVDGDDGAVGGVREGGPVVGLHHV